MSDETKEPEQNEELLGFTLLKDATKEVLIDELLAHQRRAMQEADINNLRANVIDARVSEYRKRLSDEAGLVPVCGILGQHGYGLKDEEDNDADNS